MEGDGGSGTFGDWYFSLPGRDIYAHIPVSFFEDDFNLFDAHTLPNFEELLDVVASDVYPDSELIQDETARTGLVRFYEIVHQRYVMTRAGLHEMYVKFVRGEFGKCPRSLCNGQFMLPMGPSAQAGAATLKLYCPMCQDIYFPPSRRHARLDGVGFGPTFPHLLILQYRERLPSWPEFSDWPLYAPRIFGFRINEYSSMYPRMKWLRKMPNGYR